MTDYYIGHHNSQYGPPPQSAITHTSGCTWTGLANHLETVSGGKKDPTPDDVHNRLPKNEETSPGSPGWSMPDAERASHHYATSAGMPNLVTVNRTTAGFLGAYGWNGIKKALSYDRYILVQGDSDRFADNTCSGKFNGDHCIGINPKHRIYNGRSQHWIDDGICPTGRWEYDTIIYAYAKKLADASGTPIRWCASIGKVPKV
jgi:hypothetical protein